MRREFPVAFAEVEAAARRLDGVAHVTPVMTSRTLDAAAGARVYVKCENLQRAGAFKIRGAYNAMAQLDAAARARGVVAFSSGNHSQAVALAGCLLGCTTTIVMPTDAPRGKLDATRGYGAEVLLYEPAEESREAKAAQLQRDRGLALIRPFDDARVIAGAGTAALELIAQAGEPLMILLVPVGGGGLASGTLVAARERAPQCRVFGVEPELADDARRSLAAGSIVRLASHPATIADGLRSLSVGELTFAHLSAGLSGIVTVTEAEIVAAMRFYWTRMKLVVEPSGAVSLAALLAGKIESRGGAIGVLASGGNIDLAAACALFAS